jgi:hypothetical protein
MVRHRREGEGLASDRRRVEGQADRAGDDRTPEQQPPRVAVDERENQARTETTSMTVANRFSSWWRNEPQDDAHHGGSGGRQRAAQSSIPSRYRP